MSAISPIKFDINDDSSCLSKLKNHKLKYPLNLTIGYININSVRNKLKDLHTFLGKNIDVLAISETKLDDAFTTSQLILPDYKKPLRLDCTDSSGGLLVYVRKDILMHQLTSYTFPKGMEVIPFEINLRKTKWCIFMIYRNPTKMKTKEKIEQFLSNLSSALDFYSRSYDNFIVAGDFNLEPDNEVLKNFMDANNLFNLVKEKTCFKTANGTCIDLILTNKKHSFQFSGTLQTGVSDHHLLIYTMMKTTYVKLPPISKKYRQYKNFNSVIFLNELNCQLRNRNIVDYKVFDNIFANLLDEHAPLKTRLIRANNKQHVSKDLRKAIMLRSKLKNIAVKSKNPEDVARYKRQRNLVVSMNRKAKKSFFGKHDPKKSPKGFWDTFKPLFSNKINTAEERIQLIEDGNILSNDLEISEVFNQHYHTVTDRLKVPRWNSVDGEISNDVNSALAKFADHPSVLKILENRQNVDKFEFSPVTQSQTLKVIKNLDESKSVSGVIPTKIIKLAKYVCAPTLTACFNHSLETSGFPDSLKMADIIPCHKKKSKHDKDNYRPVSLLPSSAKVFEKLIANQLDPFLDSFFSNGLCGFRKQYSTQGALLNMLQKWQNSLSNSKRIGAILMDLSKAFDCLPHELLIAKLHAYGMDNKSLSFIYSYLTNRKHRVRVGSTYSDWLPLLFGVPQGSILGPILFNVFINDLFYFVNEDDLCNFADDNTLHKCASSLEEVLDALLTDIQVILAWYKYNYLVANPEKFQLLFPGTKNANIVINLGQYPLESSECVKLLGVSIDSGLTFYPHIQDICSKASSKIKTILRIRSFLSQDQADLLFNSFVLSSFKYCPLIWMFCSKLAHNLLKNTHHRALKAKQNSLNLDYDEILTRTDCKSIHDQNLELMLVEVYKSVNNIGHKLGWNKFELINSSKDEPVASDDDSKSLKRKLRRGTQIKLPLPKNAVCLNSFLLRAGQAWNRLPSDIKKVESLESFKSKIGKIKIYCSCKLCSIF